jgi:hypothetical protein
MAVRPIAANKLVAADVIRGLTFDQTDPVSARHVASGSVLFLD